MRRIGNKRNRRSTRLETPSLSREENVETPNLGNMTLIDSNLVDQENLGPNILENQLTEPSLINNEIQVWTQEMEKRNNDRIEKMREEIDNKFEVILREIKTNKNASTITNPRTESNETQNTQPSGSKNKSIGVHASGNDNSDSENEDSYPIRASNMHELRNPAKPFCQNRFELDETLVSNEDSEEEGYHIYIFLIYRLLFLEIENLILLIVNRLFSVLMYYEYLVVYRTASDYILDLILSIF